MNSADKVMIVLGASVAGCCLLALAPDQAQSAIAQGVGKWILLISVIALMGWAVLGRN